jgi:hypothetical protein
MTLDNERTKLREFIDLNVDLTERIISLSMKLLEKEQELIKKNNVIEQQALTITKLEQSNKEKDIIIENFKVAINMIESIKEGYAKLARHNQ